jgi:mono/diheme cytochrome c family protein
VKNQGKKLMSFRAFSIGFSAALLALACGSEDSNNDEAIDPPAVPTGEDACRDNPLARDCDDSDGNAIPGAEDVPEPDDNNGDDGDDPPDQIDLERAAVQGILAENCGVCHGPDLTEQTAQGGMNFITDLDRLAEEGKLVPLDSANSLIIEYMRDGIMPPGSLEKVPTDDIQRVADFIDNPNYWDVPEVGDCRDSGQLIDFDQLFQEINDDLSGEDADDQVNFRYLVLTNRYNAGICNDTSLDRDR